MKPKQHVGPEVRKGMKSCNKMIDDGQKFPWRVQVSGMANAMLADAKFPWGSFACIITKYPIFIGLGIVTLMVSEHSHQSNEIDAYLSNMKTMRDNE